MHPADAKELGFDLKEVWQLSVACARPFMERMGCLPDFEKWICGELVKQLETALPAINSSHDQVLQVWKLKQPNSSLLSAVLHLSALRPSQGTSERGWASLSRQVQPIRNKLSARTKKILLNLMWNWPILFDRPALSINQKPSGKLASTRWICSVLMMKQPATGNPPVETPLQAAAAAPTSSGVD